METMINKAIEWFKNISESTKELTSGNVSHKACAIRGTANRGAEYLAKHKKDYSTVKWQTGEPTLYESYLVTFRYCYTKDLNTGKRLYETAVEKTMWEGCWHNYHNEKNDCRVIAWCKLSDIEPYKEERL